MPSPVAPRPEYIDDEEHIIFFTAGNPEVHRLLRSLGRSDKHIYRDVSESFRVACILGDLVLQPSSHYYESDVTRRLAQHYSLLFHRGIARFVVREDYGDFATDLEAARSAYPHTSDYSGYFDKKGHVRLRELRDFGFVHVRPGRMGATIDAFWQSGLAGGLPDERIAGRIQEESDLGTKTVDTLLNTLQALPARRVQEPFIWDLVEAAAGQQGIAIPRALSGELRRYLLRTYFRAASTLYRTAKVITTPNQFIGEVLKGHGVDRYCAQLFLSFCNSLGIRPIVERLTPEELIDFRDLLEFVPFRRAYFRIIDAARTMEEAKVALLTRLLGEKFNVTNFTHESFGELDQAVRSSTAAASTATRYYAKRHGQLRGVIPDPESMAFCGLRDAILSRYRYGLDSVAQRYGELPSGGGGTTLNYTEVVMGNKDSGDRYEIGQAGAVGPGAHAHDMNLNQVWHQMKGNLDLQGLASELEKLRNTLYSTASSQDEMIQLGAVAEAEKEARAGNGEKALEALRKVGKWGLGAAEKIGVGLAVFAIKRACGL